MSYDPEKFTSGSNKAVQEALAFASDEKNIELQPIHLAQVLFSDENGLAKQLASKLNVSLDSVQSAIRKQLRKLPKQDPCDNVQPTQKFMKILREASKSAQSNNDSHTAIDHLLLALFEDDTVKDALTSVGLTKKGLEGAIKTTRGSRKVTSASAEQTYESLSRYAVDLVQQVENGKCDPVIGRDAEIRRVIQILTRRTKNNPVLVGDPGVGKTAIVEGLAQRIVRGDVPSNLHCRLMSLDIGALVAGASHRGEFEERLKSVLKEVQESAGKIILFIDEVHLLIGAGKSEGAMDAANLLKPMLARGELRCIGATTVEEYRKHIEKDSAFERRFQRIDVAEPSVPDCVSILRGLRERYQTHFGVAIKDSALVAAATLAKRYITGRFLPDSAIDLIDEAAASIRVQLDSQPEIIDKLERRELQLNVEATALENEATKDDASKMRLSQVREELSKIREELQPLKLQHAKETERVEELRNLRKRLEQLKLKIEKAERERDYALVADLKFGALPELQKKIDAVETQLEDEKASSTANKLLSEVVGPEQIAEIVSRWTGVPVTRLTQTERERLLNLSAELHKRVIGQDLAVDAVADAVLRSRAGLARPSQPIASFLFAGPTGVGKTELAKALAVELFDDEKNMVRIDFSEYMEAHSVSRLIGAPPGYIGFESGGQLTEAVRRHPYAVILLDEIEKAHLQVLNVLLQVLDEGRLTDGRGRTVDFTNTIIILTSNLGSQHLLNSIEKNNGHVSEEAKLRVMNDIRQHFKPELLNRLDDIIVFEPLSSRQLGSIVTLQLAQLQKRLSDRDIELVLSERAIQFILSSSYNPAFGARPLRRYLEKFVTTEISKMILRGTLLPSSTVFIDADLKTNQLTFKATAHTPKNSSSRASASGSTPPSNSGWSKVNRPSNKRAASGSLNDDFDVDDDMQEV